MWPVPDTTILALHNPMRHRRKGRKLGRNPKHQRALLRNLASALFLTERDTEDLRYLKLESEPVTKGRIVTTLSKAKEVRPLVEKCITIARRGLAAAENAKPYGTDARRGEDQYKTWRESEDYKKWNEAMAPAVAARRRCLVMLGDKKAVSVLFEEVAPRFVDRPGGYTRVVRLASPRLGDAGTRAILELVGVRDRIAQKSERPAFDDDIAADEATHDSDEVAADDQSEDEAAAGEAAADESSEEAAGGGDHEEEKPAE